MLSATTDYDAVVVGAGPYGLSAAAHLMGRGLRTAVFGKPLELWRDRMPAGMLLRSHSWATNLSDPRGRFSFERFACETAASIAYPIPRETFVAYGLWFQERAVPQADDTYVSSITRAGRGFRLQLADGRTVTTTLVIVALGVRYYAHRPDGFEQLPPECVSHSIDASDFSRLNGRTVVVVGGGQSAIEYAALLAEAGAAVHVVARRPIAWRGPDRAAERTLIERIKAPTGTMAAGWQYWLLDRAPYAFYHLSTMHKDSYNSNYSSGASDWLRHRVIGKLTLHEGRTIRKVQERSGRLQLAISDGSCLQADHVMLATGFKVDVARLPLFDPELRRGLRHDAGSPLLTSHFESTVDGLYFLGLTSLRTFGPLYRFVAGCGAAARRVAADVARQHRPRLLSVPSLSWSTSES